jgi:predicted AAA+ superfamily ATPase
LRDSGLLHALLGIDDQPALESHPKLGASWEGFVIEQILSWAGDREAYFWAIQSRAELDLLLIRKGRRWGIEVKYSDAPVMTKSLQVALTELELEHVWIVHPGRDRYRLHERVECIGLIHLHELRDTLE